MLFVWCYLGFRQSFKDLGNFEVWASGRKDGGCFQVGYTYIYILYMHVHFAGSMPQHALACSTFVFCWYVLYAMHRNDICRVHPHIIQEY